ncbi:putative nucleic acid-binding protein [Halospina denitrificans]|uniref:Putative nucleic acid-binding protein n=1 Tax=Halospina denitrificans TaxID=332522 RepID=A0A4R7K0S4_9GAMM|nr:PIN domain-containing protein [Halospina denitrificans]TDT44442.1 putative nucleic acid-binding protein [Halospina denitrificans]
MPLLISDANIFIDLEEGGLIAELFQLPHEIMTPDILYEEELDEQHAHLLEMGLRLGELTPDTMVEAYRLIETYRDPGSNDCFAMALARQEQCPLLTGDSALRAAAHSEGIEVRGTLWVVEALVSEGRITRAQAEYSYKRMKAADRRLPWKEAFERLASL